MVTYDLETMLFTWTLPDPLTNKAESLGVYITEIQEAINIRRDEIDQLPTTFRNNATGSYLTAVPTKATSRLTEQLKIIVNTLAIDYGYDKGVEHKDLLNRKYALYGSFKGKFLFSYNFLNDIREVLNKLRGFTPLVFTVPGYSIHVQPYKLGDSALIYDSKAEKRLNTIIQRNSVKNLGLTELYRHYPDFMADNGTIILTNSTKLVAAFNVSSGSWLMCADTEYVYVYVLSGRISIPYAYAQFASSVIEKRKINKDIDVDIVSTHDIFTREDEVSDTPYFTQTHVSYTSILNNINTIYLFGSQATEYRPDYSIGGMAFEYGFTMKRAVITSVDKGTFNETTVFLDKPVPDNAITTPRRSSTILDSTFDSDGVIYVTYTASIRYTILTPESEGGVASAGVGSRASLAGIISNNQAVYDSDGGNSSDIFVILNGPGEADPTEFGAKVMTYIYASSRWNPGVPIGWLGYFGNVAFFINGRSKQFIGIGKIVNNKIIPIIEWDDGDNGVGGNWESRLISPGGAYESKSIVIHNDYIYLANKGVTTLDPKLLVINKNTGQVVSSFTTAEKKDGSNQVALQIGSRMTSVAEIKASIPPDPVVP